MLPTTTTKARSLANAAKSSFGNRRVYLSKLALIAIGISLAFTGCDGLQETGDATSPPPPLTDEVRELMEQLESEEPRERANAAIQLAEYPEQAPHFVPALLNVFNKLKPAPRNAAKLTFESLGEAAVKPIEPYVKSKEYLDYRNACEAINSIGPPAEVYIPDLIRGLKSEKYRWRQASVYALIPMGELNVPHLDEIGALLKDEDFNTQIFVCRLVIKMEEDAKPLAPKLRTLAEEGNASARSYAYWALGAVGPQDDFDVVSFLIDKLDEYLRAERARAVRGIAMLGEHAAEAKDELRELAKSKAGNVEPLAAYALWKVTGSPDESVDLLLNLFDNPTHQYTAMEMLVEMGSAAAGARGFFVEHLDNEDESIRELAVRGSGNLDNLKPETVEKIKSISEEDPDPLIRHAARQALNKLGESQ